MMTQLTTNYVSTRNNRFFYRLSGAGAPIVLVHGHNRDGDDFAEVAEDLARDYLVLAPDLRFHGHSDDQVFDHPAGIADLAQDLHAILQALDIQHPVLHGHSLGGMIALDYWRQYPGSVSALIVDDAFPHFVAGMNLFDLFAPSVDPAVKARFNAKSIANADAGRVPASVWESILAFDARPWLPTITVPALALLGDRGWIDAARLPEVLQTIGTSLIPGVQVETFPDCGHFTALEQPARWGNVVRAFLP
jgi:pimeloyl-ACP methyl ester carboxylesterase